MIVKDFQLGIKKNCFFCSKKLSRRQGELAYNWRKRKYCNIECHYNRNTNRTKVCLCCKKTFSAIRRRAGTHFTKRQFCSINCVVTWREAQYKNGKARPKSTHSFGKGDQNLNWKGGVTKINEKIRKSAKYKEWRRSVFERDNYTCVWCNQHGRDLNADHIKPFAFFEELRFDINNGRTLCVPCHRKTFFGNKYESIC